MCKMPLKNYLQDCFGKTLRQPFKIFPVGDSAATLDLGNTITRELNQKSFWLYKSGCWISLLQD